MSPLRPEERGAPLLPVWSGGREAWAAPDQLALHLLMLSAVVVLWLATRPYWGIIHDSRLYTLMAVAAADPARFATDMFLEFGSQDRFTAFSWMYTPVLAWLGTSLGALAATLVAQLIWLGGAYWLARTLVPGTMGALMAVAVLIAMPAYYGAHLAFSYGERFITPRLLTEALTMAALGSLLRGRVALSAVALGGAFLFHPIMAFPGVAAAFLFIGFRKRGWWAAACCAGLTAFLLAILGIEPFSRLGVQLDEEWFAIVRIRSAYVFLSQWSVLDYSLLASQVAVAILALFVTEAGARRLVGSVLAVAMLGLLLTLVGGDLARNQLIINTQAWRANWLLGVVAYLLVVPVLMAQADTAEHPLAKPLRFGGVFLLLLARLLPAAYLCSAVMLTVAVMLQYCRRSPTSPDPSPWPLRACIATIAASIGVFVLYFGMAGKDTLLAQPEHYWAQLWSFALCVSGLGLAASVFLQAGAVFPQAAYRWGVSVLAVCLLLVAVLGWDQRSAWARFVESPEAPPAGLDDLLPENATVFWDGGLELLWFRLRRPSYYSCAQAAGVVFFRGTAVAYRHRAESFRFEPPRHDLCRSGAGPAESVELTKEELQRSCLREPRLDYIVSPRLAAGSVVREWKSPIPFRDVWVTNQGLQAQDFWRFHVYPCAELR